MYLKSTCTIYIPQYTHIRYENTKIHTIIRLYILGPAKTLVHSGLGLFIWRPFMKRNIFLPSVTGFKHALTYIDFILMSFRTGVFLNNFTRLNLRSLLVLSFATWKKVSLHQSR